MLEFIDWLRKLSNSNRSVQNFIQIRIYLLLSIHKNTIPYDLSVLQYSDTFL